MLSKLIKNLFNVKGENDPQATALKHSFVNESGVRGFLRQAKMLVEQGRLNAALECYRNCAQTYPSAVNAYTEMGNVLVDLWSIEEAIAAYTKALELSPHSAEILSAIVFHTHYVVPVNPVLMFDLHRRFGEMMRSIHPARDQRFRGIVDPERPLNIGYLSPNFSLHSVGYFIEPAISHHDRERYKVYCYYNHRLSDATTERIRGFADGWRNISEMPDDAVARFIQSDNIDILIDLAGHSKGGRLGVFAIKPAPVQMTWLGYPDTTGLETVDYRLTDKIADSKPEAERWNTERLLRIDDSFLCYRAPADSPRVRERNPASEIVFCSFNNISKVNPETIRVWGQILAEVPNSRIMIKSAMLNYPDTVDRLLECFEANRIAPARVDLRGWVKPTANHLDLYGEVDIALDTFPYNGTTTTCEALWMGVPVISMCGSAHMSRVGTSILSCCGLHELVARTEEEYIRIAATLAYDAARRKMFRASLRNRVCSSPLADQERFTRKLEDQFRQSWRAWCARERTGAPSDRSTFKSGA